MDPLEPMLSKILIMMVIITAIINVVAYKKRKLADSFYYLECITRLVAIMLPNVAGYFYRIDMFHAIVFGPIYVMLFSGSGF